MLTSSRTQGQGWTWRSVGRPGDARCVTHLQPRAPRKPRASASRAAHVLIRRKGVSTDVARKGIGGAGRPGCEAQRWQPGEHAPFRSAPPALSRFHGRALSTSIASAHCSSCRRQGGRQQGLVGRTGEASAGAPRLGTGAANRPQQMDPERVFHRLRYACVALTGRSAGRLAGHWPCRQRRPRPAHHTHPAAGGQG